MSRMDNLTALRKILMSGDHQDDKTFSEALAEAIRLLALRDADVARQFDVDRSTVARWRSGTSAPHKAVRSRIFATLARRVEKAIGEARKADGRRASLGPRPTRPRPRH